ncbi:helix-turn-helix domain-containing protein [Nocardia albiluteola]|uniref:helix-turn-helix domain-containing protein n=1 Tax=Nocardia albiluteola TaxID=2842303 RepID=UPI0027E1FC80|nr:helix-turn-helix domain-containing protein [Nocardia albiluteola]
MRVEDPGREPGAEWDFARHADAGTTGTAIIGYRDAGGAGLDLRVAGTPQVTVLIQFGDSDVVIDDAEGRRAVGGFVAGLPIEAMRIRSERAECVEVRLTPIQAYSLLGVPPTDLGRGIVDLQDLWGARARLLRERLAGADTWDERFALTKSFLAQCDRPTRAPDPEVLAGWNRILTTHGQVRIGELADSFGWSRKRLLSRFEAQIGLPPKRAAMLVRFRHAVDGLLAGRPAADVAASCGYTDQAHLIRDVSIFADRTPRALTTHYLPTIARHRYRAWGTFFQYREGPAGR